MKMGLSLSITGHRGGGPPIFDPSTLSPTGFWSEEWNDSIAVRYAPGTIGDYLDADGYSGWCLVKIDSIVTNETATNDRVLNNAIWTGHDGYISLYLRSGGGSPVVGLSHYPGGASYVNVEHAIVLGEWHKVHWRFNGTQLEIGVDGDWSAPVACGNLDAAVLTRNLKMFWCQYVPGATKYTDGQIRDLGFCDYALTNDDFTDILDDYLVNTYRLPGGLDPAPTTGTKFTSCTTPNGHTYTTNTLTTSATYLARDGAALHYFNGKYWLLGGWHATNWATASTNEVWSSPDGVTWTQELTHDASPPTAGAGARWKPRHTFGSAVWNGYLWVFGGDLAAPGGGTATPPWEPCDVWRSADGTTWERMVERTPWHDSALYIGGLYNNELHVLGGISGRGYEEGLFQEKQEHWKSSDGINWERLPDPPFTKFAVNRLVTLCGKLFVIAGASGDLTVPTLDAHVWAYNGVTWCQQTNAATWTARMWAGVAAYDEKLWLLSGRSAGGVERKDTWYSEDLGQTWTELPGVPWSDSHADGIEATEAGGIIIATGYGHGTNVYQLVRT